MKNVLQISFLVLIILLSGSCRAKRTNISFSYTKAEIQRLFDSKVYLNGVKVNIDTIFLDSRNIKSFKIDWEKMTVHITQRDKNIDYLLLQNFVQQPTTGHPCSRIISVMVNGKLAVVDNNFVDDMSLRKIEFSAIKDVAFMVAPWERGIYHNCMDGTIVITTY